MARSDLALLVMDMIRSRRSERESEKDRAHDAWKLMEAQEHQAKLTQEARQYDKEHEFFIIEKTKENDALKALQTLEATVQVKGVEIDNLNDLYKSNGVKVLTDIAKPQEENFKNMATYYEERAKVHKGKKDVLMNLIGEDLSRVEQIMSGGIAVKHPGGVGYGADPQGWDVFDLSLGAFKDVYEPKRALSEVITEFNTKLAQDIYAKADISDAEITAVGGAWETANDPDATYTNSLGESVTVGQTPVEDVMGQILGVDPATIKKDTINNIMLNMEYIEGWDPEDPREKIIIDMFKDHAGTIASKVDELKADKGKQAYYAANAGLLQAKTRAYEQTLIEDNAQQARSNLSEFRVRSVQNTNYGDYYTDMYRLTPEGGGNDLNDATRKALEGTIGDYETNIASSFLAAIDIDKYKTFISSQDRDFRVQTIALYLKEYEGMIEFTEGVAATHQKVIMKPNFAEFYEYFRQAMDNYEGATTSTEKFEIRKAIETVFGGPATGIRNEQDLYNFWNRVQDEYSVIIEAPLNQTSAVRVPNVGGEVEDEEKNQIQIDINQLNQFK